MTPEREAMTSTSLDAAKPMYSSGYRSKVLIILLLVYTSNFIDRTIIGTIGQAIKVDLDLTDTQLGLLQGLAFAVLYTTLGIPIARLAERKSRVNIITICIVIWSAFTALCGIAQNFVQLLLYRVGVGIGEAGCSPPAHSLIADYYPPKARATALSIYSFGIPLGTMFGAVAGGWLAQNVSWRAAFFMVGLPGVLLALAVKLFIKEPPRGYSEATDSSAPAALTGAAPTLMQTARRLFGRWSFVHMTIGITLASFASYGTGGFVAPYFIRNFGLDYAQVGLVVGVVFGISQGAGTLLGGFLTDLAAKRSGVWYALVPAIGLAIATPLYLAVYLFDSWQSAALMLLIPGVFHFVYLGPTFGVMHNLVEPRMRATATALLFLVLNLVGLGFGPLFTGWAIDMFSVGLFDAAATGAGAFNAACPGGEAPAGAGAALSQACADSLAGGTRRGLMATVLIYAWASLHYLLAARWIVRDLREAAQRRGDA